jgi:hypothetical protein
MAHGYAKENRASYEQCEEDEEETTYPGRQQSTSFCAGQSPGSCWSSKIEFSQRRVQLKRQWLEIETDYLSDMRIFEDEVLANDDYMRDYYDLRVASKESWVSDMSCNTPLF